MTKYEMLYILDAQLTDEAKDALIAKVEDLVTKNGGVIEKTERWGLKNCSTRLTTSLKAFTF